MPVPPFNGDTFVAYLDIAGFKAMMLDGNRAPAALDAFYSAGYHVLDRHRGDVAVVDGFFLSDCGVLFVRGEDQPSQIRLKCLLRSVSEIHRRTFSKAVQITTSIAWGDFSYHERIEFSGIQKNPIYGNAYVNAYLDNEGSPKLYPSECRIQRNGLPADAANSCSSRNGPIFRHTRETQKHFYYEWMREPQHGPHGQ